MSKQSGLPLTTFRRWIQVRLSWDLNSDRSPQIWTEAQMSRPSLWLPSRKWPWRQGDLQTYTRSMKRTPDRTKTPRCPIDWESMPTFLQWKRSIPAELRPSNCQARNFRQKPRRGRKVKRNLSAKDLEDLQGRAGSSNLLLGQTGTWVPRKNLRWSWTTSGSTNRKETKAQNSACSMRNTTRTILMNSYLECL